MELEIRFTLKENTGITQSMQIKLQILHWKPEKFINSSHIYDFE